MLVPDLTFLAFTAMSGLFLGVLAKTQFENTKTQFENAKTQFEK